MNEFDFDVEATPAPDADEHEVLLLAVRAVLEREAARARPAMWTLGGWTHRRTGVSDWRRHVDASDAWRLSARLQWGGREHTGLVGRGDSK